MLKTNKWTYRYIELARQVSTWSKDPSAQIGAVAIGSAGQVLSQGYNGFPRGINDTSDRYSNRTEKYKFIVHAEMNMIYNATHNGVSLKDSTVYVYGLPVCAECCKGLIQTGVKKIISYVPGDDSRWIESTELARKMFDEADVIYEVIK